MWLGSMKMGHSVRAAKTAFTKAIHEMEIGGFVEQPGRAQVLENYQLPLKSLGLCLCFTTKLSCSFNQIDAGSTSSLTSEQRNVQLEKQG